MIEYEQPLTIIPKRHFLISILAVLCGSRQSGIRCVERLTIG